MEYKFGCIAAQPSNKKGIDGLAKGSKTCGRSALPVPQSSRARSKINARDGGLS